jgi:hypothetical protein
MRRNASKISNGDTARLVKQAGAVLCKVMALPAGMAQRGRAQQCLCAVRSSTPCRCCAARTDQQLPGRRCMAQWLC